MVDLAHVELRQVQRAIETLPPPCRRVLVLHRIQQCPISEIAAEMELSVSAVEKHLGQAVALLARAIAEVGEEQGPREQEDRRLARAAHFFVRQIHGRSAERQAALDSWLGADPRNPIALACAAAAWDKAAGQRGLTPLPVHDDHRSVARPATGEGQDQQ